MILLQVLFNPVAEHRSCLFCLFFGQAKAGTKRARDPMALSLFALKTCKKELLFCYILDLDCLVF